MSNKLQYDRGDRVGPGNAIYLQEVPPDGIYRKALFQCDYCGKEFEAEISRIKSGNTKSCGCLCRCAEDWGKQARTHGLSKTKLYHTWHKILRGKHDVCKEWENNFISFRQWAIANGYEENKAIVRKDKTKGFNPKNCVVKEKGTHSKTHGESGSSLYKFWCSLKTHCDNYSIPMDDRWSTAFIAFRDWATSNSYRDGITIERIDRTKGFTPENSYFQSFSKSQRECWLHGERMTFAEAGRRLNKSREMIRVYSTGKIKKIPEGLEFSPPND
jgi:hypothetical protein